MGLKIAVNTRLLISGKLEGIGWYSYETLKRITISHPEYHFYFLFDRPWSEEFIFSNNITPIQVNPPTRHPVLWYIWLEIAIPRILAKIKPDLFLSPDGFLPLSPKLPMLPVIHDLNFHHRPKDLPLLSRSYYQYFMPRFATKASRIVTVSEYSKRDIVLSYGIPANKIDVSYNGVNPLFLPLDPEEKDLIRATYSDGFEYFIYIGALHPRKNLPRVIKAYDLFRERTQLPYKLMIVGGRMFGNRELDQVLNKTTYRQDILFKGRVPVEELRLLLGSAFAMVFVPLFEGFGIPIIEAISCDIPVIASHVTSLPEVADNAALYADPLQVESIAGAMIRMAREPKLRQQIIRKAQMRKQIFSWDITADLLWESIQKVLPSGNPKSSL